MQAATHRPQGHTQPHHGVHPLGTQAKILLTSVFGPYARDDEHGSRALNPMELYHNQVTRVQGPFSLRMFHRSWGIMLIQANISAPCAVLDFPTRDRFIEELRNQRYDVIGITSIISNEAKVKRMCELVRQLQPQATIVVGGHIANVPDLADRIDADHVVRGEGVRWFRQYLGESIDRPLRHPMILSAIGTRSLGITPRDKPGDVAATVIPSVGCPMGCNFCSTSAMFGGKGKFVNFYETGDELFDVMDQLSRAMQVRSFFVMDENFLLYRKRALRLLELMQRYHKPWTLCVFSSGNILKSYTIEQLVGLGLSWVWMGLEGENSQYAKLRGLDTRQVVRMLQSHGIKVLGSSIVGLEEHTPTNIDQAINYAVSHDTDFHQFMLYTPIAGTALHADLTAQGRMKDPQEYDPADVHGQSIFNYRHPHIPAGMEGEYLVRAFERDFDVNGPSIVRIARTMLWGWKKYKHCPDDLIRDRMAWESRALATTYTAAVAATRLYYRHQNNVRMFDKVSWLLKELCTEFGVKARLAAALGGRYVWWMMRQEQRRLDQGWTYEPPTFYEVNDAFEISDDAPNAPARCQSVIPTRTALIHPLGHASDPRRLRSEMVF